jgi:Fur family transcriptional regulator, ferric uptake regulator
MAARGQPPVHLSPSSGVMTHDGNTVVAGLIPRFEGSEDFGSPSRQHCTAEDLAAAVQARAPDIHLTTIYRNLDELERLKIVDRTRLGHGPATYHLASAAHGHLVCEVCGSMTEVPDDMFQDLAREALDRHGFHIQPRRFAVLGQCANCR